MVSKPDFRDFSSDFTDYRDFRDFRSDFRTFVHQISEVVGPSVVGLEKGVAKELLISAVCVKNYACLRNADCVLRSSEQGRPRHAAKKGGEPRLQNRHIILSKF